jgi:hypothetical protein
MKDKLKYEQPKLISLSSSMTTMGANCINGSGATTMCVDGPSPLLGCGTGPSGPPALCFPVGAVAAPTACTPVGTTP